MALTVAEKAQRQLYRRANKPAFAAAQGRYRAEHLDKARDAVRRSTYRMTPGQFEAMELAQGSACACCGEVPKQLHVDHDHSCCATSSKVRRTCGKCTRALVCARCNRLFGFVADNVELLQKAAEYLVKHATR